MNPQEIASFIKYQLGRGVNRIEIERVLKLNQVSSEAIEQAFAAVGASAMEESPSEPTPSPATVPPLATPVTTESIPAPVPLTINKVPPPPAPAAPRPFAAAAAPAAAVRPSGHRGLWLLIIVLLLVLAGAGVFAYLKLATPTLVTIEEPLALPLATTTLPSAPADPQQLLTDFKTKLATLDRLEYQFELTGNASTTKLGALTLPANGTGSLAWSQSENGQRRATLTLATNPAASSTPISLTLPLTLAASSSPLATPAFTALGSETINGADVWHYQFTLPTSASSTVKLTQGSLWLDLVTKLPRQIKLENETYTLTLTML